MHGQFVVTLCVMSPLQNSLDVPPGVAVRSGHTTTIAWAGEKQVMVMVHGGKSGSGDIPIANTTILQFGELPLNVGILV